VIQTPTPPPGPPFDPNVMWTSDGGPPAVVMIVVFSLIAATIILWPIMRALGRRLEGKAAADPALRAELEQVQHQLSEVDQLQTRVAELEERLDFAERLLAQGQQAARLGAPTEESGR
jgi:Tfp pilus assembly protein PilO